jgi:predicted transglutaminase-like cysteine proteinase
MTSDKQKAGVTHMRQLVQRIIAGSVLTVLFGISQAGAGFVGLPRMLGPQVQKIAFAAPTLAPLAHTRFCMQYPAECVSHRTLFRGGPIALTAERAEELIEINARVNRSIRPEHNTEGLAGEQWLLSPESGDCNDYAVTKRHELMARGWPSRVLLLAEVVTAWGEHHLVLVVRTRDGDLVADSLSPELKPWTRAPYQWVRIQSPSVPAFWSTVARIST